MATHSDDKNFTGVLLEWPSQEVVQRTDLLKCSRLHFERMIESSKWEQYVYESHKPLRGEDITGTRPPYHYVVLCRRSGARLVFLSVTRNIVDHLLEKEFDKVFTPHLRRVPIAVDQLVKAIVNKPTIYVLSFVHARVPAFGSSLRSVSFYGDDLGDASLFREQMDLLVFFTCGLRNAVGGAELVRLGGDGLVSFFFTEPRRVLEVERVLSFLREKNYLTSDILTHE